MDSRAIRKKLGMNQQSFWSRLGVTQSGGSRYESGRNIPKPVQKLIAIAFGTQRECQKAVALLRGTETAPEPAEQVTDDKNQPYYVVVAGNDGNSPDYISEPVSSLAKAIDLYSNEATDYNHRCIEYHVSMTEKHVFVPTLVQKVIR